MPTASSSPTATSRVRRQRPPPGPPVEVWFWKILAKKGRGEHRTLADHVQYEGWKELARHRPLAQGRYRVEFRDARRAIVKVQYLNVPDPRSGDGPYFTEGRYRRSQRKIPPARPAWEPRAAPTSPATRPAAVQALQPPAPAPEGMIWRRRKNGTWEVYDRRSPIPENYHRLWLADSRTVVLVYSPNGTWPGYVKRTQKDGAPCLVPQDARS